LYGGEDGPSCSTTKVRVARKEHRCVECRETIAAHKLKLKEQRRAEKIAKKRQRAKKGSPA
jgi:hypothetical protein